MRRLSGRPGRGIGALAAAAPLWGALAAPLPAGEAVPPLTGRTVDRAGVLSAPTVEAVDALLERLEQLTGAQVAVLTIPTLGGEPIESYALRVAETWALGSRERDDGALLLLAIEDRLLRIEVGYGLEERLPDAATGRILREALVPHLLQGDPDAAVVAGVRRIAEHLAPGEAWHPPATPRAQTAAPAAAAGAAGPARAAPPRTNWGHVTGFALFFLLMPLVGSVYGLFARTAEARGITFGALLLPILLGGSLITDEVISLPPESSTFLLGGVLAVWLFSGLYWGSYLSLRKRPEVMERWRRRLDELADGRLLFRAAAGLGIPVSPDSAGRARWLRRAVVALLYLAPGLSIAALWHPGYAVFFFFNLSWMVLIYRGTLHPSPTSGGGRSWIRRTYRPSRGRSRTRPAASTGSSRSFRGGGGSFGGGGATARW